MLNSMRALSKSFVSKLLMGFLVISFGVWGVGDMVRSSPPNYAAKVGDSSIGLNEFQQQRQMMERQLEGMGMKNLPAGQLELAVLRQLIQQKLTLLAMQDVGLFVNEALLTKTIANMPDFADKDGKFSAERFKTIIDGQRMPEKVFLSQIKRDIAGNFMVDSLDMGDATPPVSVLALETMIQGETRDAVLITVPARDAMDEKNNAALKEFYESNKSVLYMKPESRTLEYVVLTQADIEGLIDASITDTMVDERVKADPALNKQLARIKLRSEQRDEAMQTLGNTVEDELAAGKTISEAFTKAGVKITPRTLANTTTDIAKTSEDDITKAVTEQGFTLGEGEISRLITSKKGAMLMVSAKAITPASPKPFEEVSADVRQRLSQQLAKDAARAKAATVKEALAKAPNWQAVTAEHNLPSRVISRAARPSALEQADNSIPPALRKAIFERKVGEVAGPLSMENGDQVLALVTARHLPSIDAASLKPNKQTTSMVEKLAQGIQGRAYEAFTRTHPVEVNPAIMRQPEQPQP
jgi:peptidyl-prolyl cis-trans isomerase D